MKKADNLNIPLSVIMVVAILSYPESFSVFNDLTSEDQNILQICCTWGDNLKDGVLTFHTNNNEIFKMNNLVKNSFDQWALKLENLKFLEVQDASSADVLISFEHKGEQTVGQTTNVLDDEGFIKRVKVRISVNFDEEQIEEDTLNLVLKHEIGHVLGLGHSNFHDLMNAIVNYQNKVITKCEIDAVHLANNWKLVENLQQPKLPKLPLEKTVDCGSEEL
ncbi:MAG: matrixin family metalloprotease [Nitrososphaeraceae archaeon]|nr:matrixin family metalloprotease [Nitrososphaeraceae archaeon]MDW0166057.1 matrixin family metalloprotease [Nitrososphaeraceae archaeon]